MSTLTLTSVRLTIEIRTLWVYKHISLYRFFIRDMVFYLNEWIGAFSVIAILSGTILLVVGPLTIYLMSIIYS